MSEVIFQGPVGRLEGKYHKTDDPTAPVALILHPHPLHGGTMNNKVTYLLYQTFMKRGFNTLRFNFRGIGRSEGEYADGEGELADAAAAIDWLQTVNPNASGYWIAGFSFGAWIGLQLLMRRPEVDGFVSVAPPANMYDFSFLAPCPVSGLIVQGSKDEIVPKEPSEELAARLTAQRGIEVTYKEVPEADHFFTNRLTELSEHVNTYLDASIKEEKIAV